MNRNLLTIEELVSFYAKHLPAEKLAYSGPGKILDKVVLTLSMFFLISALINLAMTKEITKLYVIFLGTSTLFLIIKKVIKTVILMKLPANHNLSQLRLLRLEDFLISKNISRSKLEHLQKLVAKEEGNTKKTFSFALPGSVLLLPLWNTFLNKYFSNMDAKDAIKIIGVYAILFISISIAFLIFSKALTNLLSGNHAILKSVNRLIEELLINGYELKEKRILELP